MRSGSVICIILALGLLAAPVMGAAKPVANFTADRTSGAAWLTTRFTDSSLYPAGWAWFFGDETYNNPWTIVNTSSGWEKRWSHTSVVLPDGTIVLTGGRNDTNVRYQDTWISTDNGVSWTRVNSSPGWPGGRYGHTSVVLPDKTVLVMGGYVGYTINDVWNFTTTNSIWKQVNASAEWSARTYPSSVVLPDGSILLMGGQDIASVSLNDTWKSADKGRTWTLINASSGWAGRYGHASVVMPDGSIVLTGGSNDDGYLNDTWRSTDSGEHWTRVNASSGWGPRGYHSSIVMPDGGIILFGGLSTSPGSQWDLWRSADNGAHWTRMAAVTGLGQRFTHSSVLLPDGSIVVTGGRSASGISNETIRTIPAGSTDQSPSHTYTAPGTYSVALQAYNSYGPDILLKSGYITVTNATDRIGVQKDGVWALDNDGSFGWTGQDSAFSFGAPGTVPVAGDWNHDNKTEIGAFDEGTWYLDYNGNGAWDGPATDRTFNFGSAGFKPVVGDWNGDDIDEVGVELDGNWAIDANGNYAWDGVPVDIYAAFGQPGDIPVVGDWDGNGYDQIGSHKDGFWAIDYNQNYYWDGTTNDRFAGLGQVGDKPVIGDWNGDGKDEIGMETDGFWAVDYDGDYVWDGIGQDRFAGLGQTGDTPVVGDWDGDRVTEIASFTDGFWAVDYNGNYAWDGVVDDRFAGFGSTGAVPVVGKWS